MLFHPLLHAEPAVFASLGAWLGLAALGAFHGLNPAMGWLFAVALGLQRGSTWAVTRALVFVSIGHAASVGVVAASLLAVGTFVPLIWVRVFSASVLLAFGLYKLFRYYRHPRWVGMQVSGRDLIVWSFMMASAHGAGLMLVPILLEARTVAASAHPLADLAPHTGYLDLADTSVAWGAGLAVHTTAMLLVMLPVALVVYKKVGLAFLRRGWINVDLLWAVALIAAGIVTALLILA